MKAIMCFIYFQTNLNSHCLHNNQIKSNQIKSNAEYLTWDPILTPNN